MEIRIITHCANALNEIGVIPGGTPKTFCDPVYSTSMSHLSIYKGLPPNEATESTISRQLCLEKLSINYTSR